MIWTEFNGFFYISNEKVLIKMKVQQSNKNQNM